jgi:hypothetical protein
VSPRAEPRCGNDGHRLRSLGLIESGEGVLAISLWKFCARIEKAVQTGAIGATGLTPAEVDLNGFARSSR